jgi:hypothetical protein
MRNVTILLMIFFVALLIGVQTVQAQYTPDGQAFILSSPITITSPANTTYTPQTLMLNFSVRTFLNPAASNITMVYNIDGKINALIATQSTRVTIIADITDTNGTVTKGVSVQSYYLIGGLVTLPEMPEGAHNITVYGRYEYQGSYHSLGFDNRTVYFTVNDGYPPDVSNLSLENKTYSQKNLLLSFTTDQSTSWMGYSLDGKENVTIVGNTTLVAIPSGPHTITVYANDTVGNVGASQTVNFDVSSLSSLTSLSYVIVGAVIIIAVVTVALLSRIKGGKEESGFTHRFNV